MAGSRILRFSPVLFRDRAVHVQVLSGVVGPAAFGAAAGVLLGISAGGSWGLSAAAAVGAFLGGFEHRGGWGGAGRGFFAGLIYGVVLLVVHVLIGSHAKVSLGSLPPLLAVITTIIGTVLSAAGARIARKQHGDPSRQDPMVWR